MLILCYVPRFGSILKVSLELWPIETGNDRFSLSQTLLQTVHVPSIFLVATPVQTV